MIEVCQAVTENEKQNIYRFRYDVGVLEHGLKQRYADHKRKMVHEPLDEEADLFYCHDQGRIIGTTRTSYADRKHTAFYLDMYDLQNMSNDILRQTVIGSKLLTCRTSNRDTVNCTLKLLSHQYKHAVNKGMRFAYIDCEHQSKLNRFYKKLGFELYRKKAIHPDTGSINIYQLNLLHRNHFNAGKKGSART